MPTSPTPILPGRISPTLISAAPMWEGPILAAPSWTAPYGSITPFALSVRAANACRRRCSNHYMNRTKMMGGCVPLGVRRAAVTHNSATEFRSLPLDGGGLRLHGWPLQASCLLAALLHPWRAQEVQL